MEIFRQLNREGVSILMITHDREIASHADRIVEIRDGVLREYQGTEAFDAALREERSTETFDEALREDQSTENLDEVPDEEYNDAAHGAALSEEDIEDENCEDAGGGDAV
jgi:ABC-type multidrug transport system ATPase subunit